MLRSRKEAFTLVEIMIVVSIIALLALFAMPSMLRARETSQKEVCINNLRQIYGAKQQWAIENFADNSAMPGMDDLAPYIKGGLGNCFCPADPNRTFGNSYDIADMATDPKCKILPGSHQFD